MSIALLGLLDVLHPDVVPIEVVCGGKRGFTIVCFFPIRTYKIYFASAGETARASSLDTASLT